MTQEQVFETIRKNIRDAIQAEIAQGSYGSIERFAYSNNLDKSFLSRILNGKREPRFSSLLRIAMALEIGIGDLMGEEVLAFGKPSAGKLQNVADKGLPGRKYKSGPKAK